MTVCCAVEDMSTLKRFFYIVICQDFYRFFYIVKISSLGSHTCNTCGQLFCAIVLSNKLLLSNNTNISACQTHISIIYESLLLTWNKKVIATFFITQFWRVFSQLRAYIQRFWI